MLPPDDGRVIRCCQAGGAHFGDSAKMSSLVLYRQQLNSAPFKTFNQEYGGARAPALMHFPVLGYASNALRKASNFWLWTVVSIFDHPRHAVCVRLKHCQWCKPWSRQSQRAICRNPVPRSVGGEWNGSARCGTARPWAEIACATGRPEDINIDEICSNQCAKNCRLQAHLRWRKYEQR